MLEYKASDKENILGGISSESRNKELDWDWGFSVFHSIEFCECECSSLVRHTKFDAARLS